MFKKSKRGGSRQIRAAARDHDSQPVSTDQLDSAEEEDSVVVVRRQQQSKAGGIRADSQRSTFLRQHALDSVSKTTSVQNHSNSYDNDLNAETPSFSNDAVLAAKMKRRYIQQLSGINNDSPEVFGEDYDYVAADYNEPKLAFGGDAVSMEYAKVKQQMRAALSHETDEDASSDDSDAMAWEEAQIRKGAGVISGAQVAKSFQQHKRSFPPAECPPPTSFQTSLSTLLTRIESLTSSSIDEEKQKIVLEKDNDAILLSMQSLQEQIDAVGQKYTRYQQVRQQILVLTEWMQNNMNELEKTVQDFLRHSASYMQHVYTQKSRSFLELFEIGYKVEPNYVSFQPTFDTTIPDIIDYFEDWMVNDRESFEQAFIHLCVVDVLKPTILMEFVQKKIPWSCNTLDSMSWFTRAQKFNIVTDVMEKIVLPYISSILFDRFFDWTNAESTRSLVNIVSESSSLISTQSEAFRELLAQIDQHSLLFLQSFSSTRSLISRNTLSPLTLSQWTESMDQLTKEISSMLSATSLPFARFNVLASKEWSGTINKLETGVVEPLTKAIGLNTTEIERKIITEKVDSMVRSFPHPFCNDTILTRLKNEIANKNFK